MSLMATPNLAFGASADVGGTSRYDVTRAVLTEASDDPMTRLLLVRRIGCIYCQSQRHGYQARPAPSRAARCVPPLRRDVVSRSRAEEIAVGRGGQRRSGVLTHRHAPERSRQPHSSSASPPPPSPSTTLVLEGCTMLNLCLRGARAAAARGAGL